MINNEDFAIQVIERWSHYLEDGEREELIIKYLYSRYQGEKLSVSTPDILRFPSSEGFYASAISKINELSQRRYPVGDYYRPGDQESKLPQRYLNRELRTSFDEVLAIFLNSSEASELSKISLFRKVQGAVDCNWQLSKSVTGLRDILALRFMPLKVFSNNTSLLEDYFKTFEGVLNSIVNHVPTMNLADTNIFKRVLSVLHDTVVLDLLHFSTGTQSQSFINDIVFIDIDSPCLDLSLSIRRKHWTTLRELLEKVALKLSKMLECDSTHEYMRMLDPLCFIFARFIGDVKTRSEVLAMIKQKEAMYIGMDESVKNSANKFLNLPKEFKVQGKKINQFYDSRRVQLFYDRLDSSVKLIENSLEQDTIETTFRPGPGPGTGIATNNAIPEGAAL